jgi:hypothetical protein
MTLKQIELEAMKNCPKTFLGILPPIHMYKTMLSLFSDIHFHWSGQWAAVQKSEDAK